MKVKGVIPTRIIMEFYDSFTNDPLGGINMSYSRIKSVNNFYSKLWRKWKLFLSNEYKIDKDFVRVRITFKS